ncbi:MAG: hypothetical protein MI723_09440, partial [Caulobacterales bacterium]|nr:hypothetical protein [Caulobacterales bacterium]
ARRRAEARIADLQNRYTPDQILAAAQVMVTLSAALDLAHRRAVFVSRTARTGVAINYALDEARAATID